jgi:hypothetical protein
MGMGWLGGYPVQFRPWSSAGLARWTVAIVSRRYCRSYGDIGPGEGLIMSLSLVFTISSACLAIISRSGLPQECDPGDGDDREGMQ